MGGVALLARLALGLAPADGFTFAAGGDLIGPYVASFDPATDDGLAPVAALCRGADLGFANQEGAIFDLESFRGSDAAENGGGTPVSPALVARGLKSLGITVVSKANNHATDWGVEGLEATWRSLATAGLLQAGSGSSLAEARAPVFVPTRHGLAALVSVASTFPPMSVAGDPKTYRGQTLRPRAGISALRVRAVRKVSAEDFARLRQILGAAAWPVPGRDDEVRVGDVLYRRSTDSGITWEMKPDDEAAVLASVRQARQRAAFVLFAIHCALIDCGGFHRSSVGSTND